MPDSTLVSVNPLEGNFSNFTHLVQGRAPDGSFFQIVTRRYAIFGDYDRGEKAQREFKTLRLLQRSGLPVPDPLYLDEAGILLGSPGMVTRYVPGKLKMVPPFPAQWTERLARTLAQIHTVPLDESISAFLLDGNSEVLWFLKSSEQIPAYIDNHPKGNFLWRALVDYLPHLKSDVRCLVHLDYWSGNILWHQGEIVAVVDWEEAALGDPGIDVAYCRMDMILSGLREAADQFLTAYEREVGEAVAHLGFWELAAAVRPMFSPDGWISESPAKERFSDFVDSAIRKLFT